MNRIQIAAKYFMFSYTNTKSKKQLQIKIKKYFFQLFFLILQLKSDFGVFTIDTENVHFEI